MYTTRFATIDDVINSLADALDGTEYDLDAIARATHEWTVDIDEDGRERLDTAGYERSVSDDEMWAIAEQHTI